MGEVRNGRTNGLIITQTRKNLHSFPRGSLVVGKRERKEIDIKTKATKGPYRRLERGGRGGRSGQKKTGPQKKKIRKEKTQTAKTTSKRAKTRTKGGQIFSRGLPGSERKEKTQPAVQKKTLGGRDGGCFVHPDPCRPPQKKG